jgi:hypothetical protein
MAWTDRIVEEFCSQGDRERAEGKSSAIYRERTIKIIHTHTASFVFSSTPSSNHLSSSLLLLI